MKTHGQKSVQDPIISSSPNEEKTEEQKRENWKDDYLRVLADYRNLVKRTEEEKKVTWANATASVVEKLLPIFDNLERADAHLHDQGLSLALQEASVILKSLGVEKLDCIGQEFDPYSMDCVEVTDGTPGKVVSVIESGYSIYDRILRPAKVTVGKQTMKSNSIEEKNIS